ncbi:MAG: hypothetical protein FWB84_05305, partial [Candidatus Bathyarchaeota archaeon]|uniref:hypothetical protein n=1 Tax=Candidatus Bathycorpusculum sp. TaxID=2994959 RepID=UPI00283370E3|nr:hypothetical protein [Candidatus Termiticorpusculum sp.]
MNLLHTYPNIKTKPATNRLALRTISVALTIALLMSMFTVVMAGVASAAWPEFQGNPNRTGQITNGVPPTTTPTVTIANLGLSLYGINVEPVLETVNGITYAYVLYPSGALSGASIAKIDVSNPTPALIWTTSLSARGVSQLSTPYLDNDYIYVGISLSATTSELASVNKITGVSTTLVSGIAGQINTPITKYGNYLYFGTYNGNNEYFQYNLSTNTYTKFIGYSDFYWAGAYSNGTHVFFGGDGGYLYCLPVASFGGSASSSNTVTLPAGAGDVRSSISRDGNYLYFTSKGGYLWRILVSNIASVSSVRVPNATTPLISTSTPAISQAEHIYVGYYSSLGGGGNGGV